MNCREFEDRLNAVLDNRGQPHVDALLVDHASDCEPCRQVLAGQQALFAGLAHLPVPRPAPALAARVIAEAIPTTQVRSRAVRSRIGWAIGSFVSTAAAALLVVSLVWYARQGDPTVADEAREDAAGRKAGGPGGFAILNPGVGKRSRPEAQTNPRSAAAVRSDWLIEAPRIPSHLRDYRGAIGDLAVTLPDTVEQLNEMEQYAPGIRPIYASLTVLFDTLWRTLPGSREGTSEPVQPSTSGMPIDALRVA